MYVYVCIYVYLCTFKIIVPVFIYLYISECNNKMRLVLASLVLVCDLYLFFSLSLKNAI